MVQLRIVRYDHTVGHYHARSILVAREESERVARVHHEGLFVGHSGKVLHHEAVLCPVLEYGTVASVGDELVRVLGHTVVQIVLDHRHDCSSLT